MSASPEVVSAALVHAANGLPVFPVKKDKTPATLHGHLDASLDAAKITEMFAAAPEDAGLACATGNGVVVLDVDPRHNGDDSLDTLTEGGKRPLPPTPQVLTGGGGRHFYFSVPPGVRVPCRTGLLSGLDVRGDGGYVVMPPSVHASGRRYEWEASSEGVPLAPVPDWLLELILKGSPKAAPLTDEPEAVIHEGQRHSWAARHAGKLRRASASAEEILAALRTLNKSGKFKPPHDDADLERIARDIGGKPVSAATAADGAPNTEEDPILDEAERAEREYLRPPVDALGEPLAQFVHEAADGLGVDPAFVLLPLMAAAAGAIGNAAVVELKRGFRQPAIVWAGIVGESCTAKSPAVEQALAPMESFQRCMDTKYSKLEREYSARLAAEASKPMKGKEAGEVSPPPVRIQRIVSDSTVEALADVLKSNSRGVICKRDELAGWLKSMNQYKKQGGADVAHWLEAFDGRSARINRKSSGYVYVPHFSVSIVGGIQPGLVHSALPEEYHVCGLAPRLLLAWPPRRRLKWNEERVLSETAEKAVNCVFDGLLNLAPESSDPFTGEITPRVLKLAHEAKKIWRDFYDAHHEEGESLEGSEASAWGKIELYAARFALIFACVKAVWKGRQPVEVDADCMMRAVQLARWCGIETRRVLRVAKEGAAATLRRSLLDWLRRREPMTANELRRSYRPLRGAGKAEAALEDLVRRGYGTWQESPSARKGHVERRFVARPAQGGQGGQSGQSGPVDNVDGGGSPPPSEGEV
ncbi:MAG: DUF3987 domain-containing protein [Planctomycetia bacterium]|nr:DUF3987 domain-containing protein [Planctomycetia bacterium]